MKIRKAIKKDIPVIIDLIKELALYEKAPQEVTITAKQLEEDGFGEAPLFWILLAENEDEVLGMSFYYIRYSTWKGKCLYLEDIVVKEAHRRGGIGKKLFDATVAEAKEMNAALMCWQVLDWNAPAIAFYKKYNANFDDEWLNCKMTAEQIKNYKVE